MQIDTTVLGGLPVTIEFTIDGPDYEVGIMSSYVAEWYVVAVNGRKVKSADWIVNRMTKKDEDRLIDELNEYASEHDYYED